jgi:hypothetical protein
VSLTHERFNKTLNKSTGKSQHTFKGHPKAREIYAPNIHKTTHILAKVDKALQKSPPSERKEAILP